MVDKFTWCTYTGKRIKPSETARKISVWTYSRKPMKQLERHLIFPRNFQVQVPAADGTLERAFKGHRRSKAFR